MEPSMMRILLLSCALGSLAAAEAGPRPTVPTTIGTRPIPPVAPQQPADPAADPSLGHPAPPRPPPVNGIQLAPAGNAPGPVAKNPPPPAATPPAVPLAGRDLIILDNKQSIVGTIVEGGTDDGFVVLNTGSGTMRIRKERVKSVVLGLEGQLKHVDTSDLASLVALARWCQARGHDKEALAALDKAVTMPGVDLETRGLHALLVDAEPSRGPKAALPLYRKYKADGGHDLKILSRLQQLEDAVEAHNQDLKKLNLPPDFIPAEQPNQAVADTAPKPNSTGAAGKDGLESRGWQAEDAAYSNAVEAKPITLAPEEGGGKALAMTVPAGGTKDKAAIRKLVNYSVDENSVLSLLIRDRSDHPVKIAIAVKTVTTVNGKEVWNYFESLQQSVAPAAEFKEVRFNLKASTFKSAATGWDNKGKISDLDAVKELQLLIYNGKDEADVLIRGMGFVKDSEM
jgi:hypothetical protein